MAINEQSGANPVTKQKNEQALKKGIKLVATNATKLNTLVHEMCVLSAIHAKNYGDTNFCAELVDAMPMSYRRSLVINWFDAFTPVGIQKNGKTQKMKAHLKGKAEERDKMWNIEAGKATPWFAMPDVEREPDVPTFDSVLNNILSFVKRMEKKAGEITDEDERQRAEAKVASLKTAIG